MRENIIQKLADTERGAVSNTNKENQNYEEPCYSTYQKLRFTAISKKIYKQIDSHSFFCLKSFTLIPLGIQLELYIF